MTNRQIYYPKLAQRVAQEAQLLAEEKWIIQALKKIKEQRNCLQIERLHLENKRAQLLKEYVNDNKTSVPPSPSRDEAPTTSETNLPTTSIVSMMQANTGNSVSTSVEYFPVSMDNINNEELNLSITNSVFSNQCHDAYDMEEEEEDLDNCLIDMNMLMNGGKP